MATNGSPACLQRRLDHRMASALDREAQRGVDQRARPVALDCEFGERRGDVDLGQRGAEVAQAFALGEAGLAQALERLEFERERLVGRGGDARLEIGERVGGEAHRAGHRLAMDEGRAMRSLEQRLAGRLRGLDVIAEKVVVLDLELPDAGFVGVGRLQPRDHTAAFVAQAARFVERGFGAGADKPAVALEQRQIVGERGFEIARELRAIGAQPRVGAEELGREILSGLENAGQSRRRGEAVADRGKVARTAAVEAQARESPQKIGRVRERPTQGVAHRRRLDQEIKRVEPPVDGLRIGQRARQPLGEQARAGRGHGQVDRRQERAIARAAQGSGKFEVRAGGRIDFEARPAPAPGRGERAGRASNWVRLT